MDNGLNVLADIGYKVRADVRLDVDAGLDVRANVGLDVDVG